MHAHVRIATPDGSLVDLLPGDLIGRLSSAALRLDDSRVSEAHALVSLRGASLKLLALRGVLAVDGKRLAEVVLTAGLQIEVAPDLKLTVVEVTLPEFVLGLALPGLPVQTLTASVYSLRTQPVPGLTPRHNPAAAAHVWSTGDGWRLRIDDESRALEEGDRFTVDGVEVEAVGVPLGGGQAETRLQGALHGPIRLEARFETVHLHRDGHPTATLNGIGARIVSELVSFGGPVAWEVVAGEIWRDETERESLRRRWDVSLARLRRRLKALRLRADLIHPDGKGHVELLLQPGDTVDDRT